VAEVVYDAGALIAAERRMPALWALHAELIEAGTVPRVPVAALAQGWRGGPQPMMSGLLRSCHVEDMVEDIGRGAGAACAASGTADVVDAAVVVTAVMVGATLVVTSDPDDLAPLVKALGVGIRLYKV
jgi:hypothetical protein